MSGAPGLLVLGDYPVGYPNGIGETLDDLLQDAPDTRLVDAHPSHLPVAAGRTRGRSLTFDYPRPPLRLGRAAAVAYKPVLKARQALAARALVTAASAWIAGHRIGAVLTYPVTPWVLFAAVRLRRAFPRVRFVFYVMDDWEGHHTCFGLPFTAKRRAALTAIVKGSDARFACSQLMAADYERRFGTSWQVLHRGAVAAAAPKVRTTPFASILYAGGLNVFRLDAVMAFAEGLGRFRARAGRDVTLTLLGAAPTPEQAAALAAYPFVRTEPWVDNEACRRRMAEADLLYLPLSFLPRVERIANLAMPTKFPEYLASGRPAIFHVPAASEVHALAAAAGLGLTLPTVDPDAIAAFLHGLDRPGWDAPEYHGRAAALLAAEFNPSSLRARLWHACFPEE